MMNYLILASEFTNAGSGSKTLLDGALLAHNAFRESIDEMWVNTFNGGVYRALVSFAITITVIGLFFFTIKLMRQWLENELSYESIQSWIIAFLVCLLLANNGLMLKNVIFGLRDISNQVNQNFLNSVRTDVTLAKAIKSVSSSNAIKNKMTVEIKKCESYVDPLKKEECLDAAAVKIDEMAKEFELTKKDKSFIDSFREKPIETAYKALGNAAQLVYQGIIVAILFQMSLAVQLLAEFSFLLTGLIAPIPVAFTLIPGNFQTIFKWIVAFLSIGMFKLYYNTIVGFTAVLMLETNWIGDIAYGFMAAIFAPLLAGALMVGAGLAIMTSCTQGFKTIFRLITLK